MDIFSYQRIDEGDPDRRRRSNRKLELVAENVVINPNVGSDSLFDASGEEVPTANFELRPFDKTVGHEELVILWDNRAGDEKARFDSALAVCQTGLVELAPAYRGQNTHLRPVPVVPRNAALKLQFSGDIHVTDNFFSINPSALQLLELKGDPAVVGAANAFRILPYRVINKGTHLILDTTILGGEGPQSSPGLPQSSDMVTANIRVAIPSRGSVVSSFYVKEDSIAQLNGVDSANRNAVIRDFRSGNYQDGTSGKLPDAEKPMIVGSLAMGITAIDPINRTVTLNKREHFVPIRGRYPFVDGPLRGNDIPTGPVAVPTLRPLRSGDILTQDLLVDMPDGTIEKVTVRAEILQNMAIGAVIGGPIPVGLIAGGAPGEEQGQMLPTATVRVASLEGGRDSLGRVHSFQDSSTPEGRDCVLRALYYEDVPFGSGGQGVSDADWRHEFLRAEPKPQVPSGAPGTPLNYLDPLSSVAIEFTKPVDFEQLDNTANLLLTSMSIGVESFSEQLTEPKRATARVVQTRLADLGGDGTVLRLQPPMGFHHVTGTAEVYAFHVKLGSDGVLDLGGNEIDVYGDPTSPDDSWSVDISIKASADENLIGWKQYLFNNSDEDGSLPGSVDMFGQFRLQDGRLLGATGVRFSRSADSQNLGGISRIHRGECWDPNLDPTVSNLPPTYPQGVPAAPTDNTGAPHQGFLYWNPHFFDQVFPPAVPHVYEYWTLLPQNVGRVAEPLNPKGSRMQMRYIEDDFTLDYHQAAEFGIDVDQLYWSPFNDETVFYDVFDRMSMYLSHANKRPDEFFEVVPGDQGDPNAVPPVPPVPPGCNFMCPCVSSALSTVFADNVLEGTEQVPVFEDVVYEVNPNTAFRNEWGVKYVPFPRFDRSYTWRDSRLVTVDASGEVIGLGGAQAPADPEPNNDFTARISSPWVTDDPPENFIRAGLPLWCIDEGDFKGDQRHDHDPIALPLLVDFHVFADSAVNGLAAGSNSFQVATLGGPSNGNPAVSGYYDTLPAGCNPIRPPWPSTRAHATGGTSLVGNYPIEIDPSNQLTAQVSILKDAGLGDINTARFAAPPRDGMLHWAHADFVREVSTVTFGFIDTLKPQWAKLVVYQGGVPDVQESTGFPDLEAVNPSLRISDFVTQLDPPQGRQPSGTSVLLEIRGAESFDNDNELYNPLFAEDGETASDQFDERGNILNPNYACEAYRYSQANHSEGLYGGRDTPRVTAGGLTRYVTEDQLSQIRDPATGLLPRFLNLRLVMTNNTDVTPALSPSLRSMGIVYRVQRTQ
ncbi:MAG: hypothetical protein KDC98_08030 [Planctomycetes bacterium]|nr:hypothetical protein [Planctomycetota bacterium]